MTCELLHELVWMKGIPSHTTTQLPCKCKMMEGMRLRCILCCQKCTTTFCGKCNENWSRVY